MWIEGLRPYSVSAFLPRAGKLERLYLEGLRPYSVPASLPRADKLEGLYLEGLSPYSLPAFLARPEKLKRLLGLHFLSFWPFGPSFPFILTFWAFISFHFSLLGLHFL